MLSNNVYQNIDVGNHAHRIQIDKCTNIDKMYDENTSGIHLRFTITTHHRSTMEPHTLQNIIDLLSQNSTLMLLSETKKDVQFSLSKSNVYV